MTRDDVIRITEDVLRNLRVEVKRGGFTDPNSRTVHLMYDDTIISTDYFDVVQQDEYEG